MTVYLGAVEVHVTGTERVTKTYYHAGGQRIAMRENGEVTYLHGDHLGSASLATDASGALLNEMRYTPYGVTRSGDMPTDRRYTDQRWESGLGLYDYGARFYSAALGRFVSADTIVPNPQNPQDFNRYALARNNPLKYTDPSGHSPILGLMLVAAGTAALAVEIHQISSYAKAHDQGFWETLRDPDFHLNQVEMIDAAIQGAMIVPMVVGGAQLLLAGGGDILQQGGMWLDNPVWWNRGMSLHDTAARFGTWIYGVSYSPGSNAPTVEELLELRSNYESRVRSLDQEAQQRLKAGQSVEEVAAWAYGERRALGMMFKDATPPELRDMIYARNIG